MTVRPAKFGDIPRLVVLLKQAHGRSIYARVGNIDEKAAKALLMQSIQRQGLLAAGGTFAAVAEKHAVVEGFLVGIIDRGYHIGDRLMATDMFFYLSEWADPRDAGRLLDAEIAWAAGVPGCVVLRAGVTDAIGDYRRAARLYERRGFRQSGALFERRLGA